MKLFERFRANNKVISEILGLIFQNKKWWLIPLFLVFWMLSVFLVLLGGSSVLPAIYALF